MATTHFYNKGVRTNFGVEYTLSAYHVLWPIPQNAINDNSQGRINQNKGVTNSTCPLTEIPE